jgi:hypothetical protein
MDKKDESEPTFPRHVLRGACYKSCDGRKAAENLMNRMMNYRCSTCSSVCLCTSSLTQTTTCLQAAILPSIPLPASRANLLVECEHPKFGNTGPSHSDNLSRTSPFKERPPWGQMSTFSRQTLAPSITSASRLPGPSGSNDGRHFELHNNKDHR